MGTELVESPPDPVVAAYARGAEMEDRIDSPGELAPPSSITKDDASALVFFYGDLLHTAEKVRQATLTWYEKQQKRLESIHRWYGAALKKLAQESTGKKGRRLLLPFGVLALRKEPDRLVQKEGDEALRAFKVFDARAGHKWTRVKARFDSLTHEELSRVIDALPDDLLAKLRYELEPEKAELSKLWKATGEVAAGFEVKFGEDQLTIDFSTKEESA